MFMMVVVNVSQDIIITTFYNIGLVIKNMISLFWGGKNVSQCPTASLSSIYDKKSIYIAIHVVMTTAVSDEAFVCFGYNPEPNLNT